MDTPGPPGGYHRRTVHDSSDRRRGDSNVNQSTLPDLDEEQHVGDKVRDLFGDDYAVIIMDSDFTTFDEVEQACMALFGYTRTEAQALSARVHTTGEALAAVMAHREALQAVRRLRSRNVLARAEKV
jgi:ATP-dependent Clp protease adapter protein ClpS